MSSDLNQSSNGWILYLIFIPYNALKPAQKETKKMAGCHFRPHKKNKKNGENAKLYIGRKINYKRQAVGL